MIKSGKAHTVGERLHEVSDLLVFNSGCHGQ